MPFARPRVARAKPEEAGSGNPDPKMKPAGKSGPDAIKGENMPPRGGEDIAPADGRSPKRSQDHVDAEDGDKS